MIVRTVAVALLLSGCASVPPPKTFYADWIAIGNPRQLCAGADSCVKYSHYKGKALCTLVTADKDVSTSQVGILMNQCMN